MGNIVEIIGQAANFVILGRCFPKHIFFPVVDFKSTTCWYVNAKDRMSIKIAI